MKTFMGVLILFLLANAYACTKNASEKETEERKTLLLTKIKQEQKLTGIEISNLSGILLAEEKYEEGIDIFEKLKSSDNYKDERYKIYFSLSLFYTEKSKKIENKEEQQRSIKRAEESLNSGFDNTPELALAFYKRAKVHSVMGCIEESRMDLQKATDAAKSKDTVYFGDGVYLNRENFMKIINEDLKAVKSLKEDCILKK